MVERLGLGFAPSFLPAGRGETFPRLAALGPGEEVSGVLAFRRLAGEPPDAITVTCAGTRRRIPLAVAP